MKLDKLELARMEFGWIAAHFCGNIRNISGIKCNSNIFLYAHHVRIGNWSWFVSWISAYRWAQYLFDFLWTTHFESTIFDESITIERALSVVAQHMQLDGSVRKLCRCLHKVDPYGSRYLVFVAMASFRSFHSGTYSCLLNSTCIFHFDSFRLIYSDEHMMIS